MRVAIEVRVKQVGDFGFAGVELDHGCFFRTTVACHAKHVRARAIFLTNRTAPKLGLHRRRQFLNPYPGKEWAELFDLIVVPAELSVSVQTLERDLWQQEWQSYLTLADSAINRDTAMQTLRAGQMDLDWLNP